MAILAEPTMTLDELKAFAKALRIDILEMIAGAGSGHPGGSLSSVELVSVLFHDELGRTKDNALDPDRHRFVISKGHGVPTVYCILARLGIIQDSALKTFRELDSPLQGHPDRIRLPTIESATGSLGQGLSVAQGMAMGSRLKGNGARVYCLLGDGEMQEGQVWETMMSAPKFQLDNFLAILDANGGQLDDHTAKVMPIEDMAKKAEAFNWHVMEIDGHDVSAVRQAYAEARSTAGKPSFIVARTVKGKGVSFMENNIGFHGKAPSPEQTEQALAELRA